MEDILLALGSFGTVLEIIVALLFVFLTLRFLILVPSYLRVIAENYRKYNQNEEVDERVVEDKREVEDILNNCETLN